MKRHDLVLPVLIFLLVTTVCNFSSAQKLSADTLRIFYPLNQSLPSPTQKASIDSFISIHYGTKIHYQILGYADYLSSDTYNLILSQKRADEVKTILTSGGVVDEKILSCKGLGVLPPVLVKSDKQGIPANRRVDLIVQYVKEVRKDTVINKQVAKREQPALQDMKAGEKMVLRNLNFEGGTHYLLPEALPVLDSLLETLQKYPGIKIEIQGHICCQQGPGDGADMYTGEEHLSVQRAKYVYDYLVEHGIDAGRLRYKGFGHSHPIYTDESTEKARASNRRVEVMIIK